MAGAKTCGAHCQHPTCWASGKDEMIEAYKRMGLAAKRRSGYSHRRPAADIEQSESRQIRFDEGEDAGEAVLPTLKIVNVFEKDEEQDNDGDERSSAYVLHLYNSKKGSSFPVSSAATRSSKLPKAPCASPSQSFVSHLKKQGKMDMQKWSFDEYKEEGANSADTVQATNVKIQGEEIMTENEYTPTFVPYLVWIPSKKKKKRKKCGSSGSRSNQVSMKNITGSNSDFGFLPNDKDVSLRCYSRATHTVRSSPSKIHPKKLPPLSHDASERLRSPTYQPVWKESNEMLLSGNSLSQLNKETLPSKAVTPVLMSLNTPHNTRASIRTRGNTQRRVSEEPRGECKIIVNENDDGLRSLGNETLVMHPAVDVRIERAHTLNDFTRYENEARLHQQDVKEHREQRTELFLPRVTVPKDKLRKLPVVDHCRNSVPSHYLYDIQMQPVYGTDKTVSQISSTSSRENVSQLGGGGLNWRRESMEVESQITEEEYVKIFETVVKEKRGQLNNQTWSNGEGLDVNWQQDILRAPAPTPSSPRKHLDHVLSRANRIDAIEVVREEQSHGDAKHHKNFENETRPMVDAVSETASLAEFRIVDEAESKGSKATSVTISPVPSKTSSGDWPSDKEFIKQTYEQYRSFTPFKMPCVSLMDTRLESIREFSREQTCMAEKERSTILMGTPKINCLPFDANIIPDFFSHESLNKQTKAKAVMNKSSHHLTPTSRSKIIQRRSHEEIASELSVSLSTLTPREKELHSNTYGPTLSVKRMALQDPVTKQKHDYVSSYELYEASVDVQKSVTPIIIPVPLPTPCNSCYEGDHKNTLIETDENRNGLVNMDDDYRKDTVAAIKTNGAQDACTNETVADVENSRKDPDVTRKENDFANKDEVKLKSQNEVGNFDENSNDRRGVESLKEADTDDHLVDDKQQVTSETKVADDSNFNSDNTSSLKSHLQVPSTKIEVNEVTDSHDRDAMEDSRDEDDDCEDHGLPIKLRVDNSHIIEEFRYENSCSLITLSARPVMYTDLDEITNVGSNFDYSEYDLSMDLNFVSDFSVNLDMSIDLDEIKNAMAELYDTDEKENTKEK